MRVIEPIAIVGIGCRLPGGVRSPEALWKLLTNGVDAVTEVPENRWLASALYHPDSARPGRMNTRWGGFLDHIDRFDAQFFGISPREAAPADPQQRLLLEVAYEATEDAGITMASLAGKRAGVYVGIGSYDYGIMQLSDRAAIDAYTNHGSSLCIAANRISYFFDLMGPSLAVDTACSSSLVAVDLACRSIWDGDIELAFAAGVNVIARPDATIGFSKASMLSPDGRCKAFDARANGFVRGEGAAIVILKPLAHAIANRDQVYAVIRATAVNQDGRTEGISVPSRASQESNLRDALRIAAIAPESIQYVEAHGTGTPVGDPIEAAAIGEVYGGAQRPGDHCVIGSIKTNVGHLEAASGMVGLIKTALCLRHRQIPPNLHFERPNPQIPFDDLRLRVARRLRPWPETYGHPPRAAVNSFGFGGTNAHAVLEAAPDFTAASNTSAKDHEAGSAWMLPLSARSASTLPDVARSYLLAIGDRGSLQHAAIRDICFSAGAKRSHHEFRLALVVHDKAELKEQLEASVHGEASPNISSGHASSGSSKPVFVCSGMGQQWWAMSRELLKQESVYRSAVEQVDDLFGRLAGWSLLHELTADEKSSRLQQTRFGQPAIFALQVGLAALWRSWGVEPAAVLGHSAGEMAASYISGALSLEDAARVTYHRSRLQQQTAGQGAMLAVGISYRDATRLVERYPKDISIAAINGLNAITLSGDAAVLAQIDKSLNEAGQFSRALQVDVPFHSPKMEQLQTELIDCLCDIRPLQASTPFFSTVTGTALTGCEIDAQYWYRNIREPVLFHDTMARVIDAGHKVFLELGAHPILRREIVACLNERSLAGTTIGSLWRGRPDRAAALGALGQLFCGGTEVDWRGLFPTDTARVKLPAYPFQPDSHWREADQMRRMRRGETVHPLLGSQLDTAQPTWSAKLDSADLAYLADHRIGNSTIFPAAGYVEMAFAAARETFGSVACSLEDIEFEKFLVLDEKDASSAQVVFEPGSNHIDVYAYSHASGEGWESHARGYIRKYNRIAHEQVDLAGLRERFPNFIDVEELYKHLADAGYNYGPTFRGIAKLWQGDEGTFAEIHIASGIREQSIDYRLHPVILDACFQAAVATMPAHAFQQSAKGKAYVPVRIERVRLHAAIPAVARLFVCARLQKFDATVLKADLELFDEQGSRLLDVQGLICRPIEHRVHRRHSTLYEYQWRLSPRPGSPVARFSEHLVSPNVLAPLLRHDADILGEQLDRTRFQNEFRSAARATAAAYIVRALRELGGLPGSGSRTKINDFDDHPGLAPQYRKWLRLMFNELSAEEIAAAEDPQRLWRMTWNEFPECQAELELLRTCGENLASVLRGHVDPLNLIFPEGEFTTTEHLYQDSPSLRFVNLLAQRAILSIVQRLPKGKFLRILELGGGTGGMTSFILPVLPQDCVEYVFTDVSSHFMARAQQKFAQYPFVQYRTLDIERDPLEQGFDPHSFDLIVASDVLHATKDLRKTLGGVKQLLGSGGYLLLGEVTHPWLNITLIFGLLKGWWLFNDDIRRDQPCISQEHWKNLLAELDFSDPICIADAPDADSAQHSVIMARGPQLPQSPAFERLLFGPPKVWLVFADRGDAGRSSAGGQIASELRERGDDIIEVMQGVEFRELDGSTFAIRPGNIDDMRQLMASVRKQVAQVAGIVHLWSLDIETNEAMTSEELTSSARLGCIGVLQLFQTLTVIEGLAVDAVWLITRGAQSIADGAGAFGIAQSPLWGLGRVAATEYKNLHCHLLDLATLSREEIASVVEELNAAGNDAEDEIALHGELRYVHRLIPVSQAIECGIAQINVVTQPFRIELERPGILESLSPRRLARARPKPHEVEIEVAATGLNFKDLMHAMGMVPKDAITDSAGAKLLGLECAGRVVAVGDAISGFVIGDEVVAIGGRCLASHLTIHERFVARKPLHLSMEQAATIPIAFVTAFYSLHTLGRIQAGERVLIHSAAGGVGLAAVQLAMKAGAIVFATAGTTEKRELLSALGVPHVLDSHSLAFADEILELTKSEGIDLVLNSLAGEAIDKNLSILRPFGRYIEIGLVDIYKNRKMGMRPLRENISIFAVDLSRIFVQPTDLCRSLLTQVLGLFASDDLRPLPHRVFPITRLVDALRHMAQAKHVGKLIISIRNSEGLRLPPVSRASSIAADACYLITGGLGGFGLAVAERLAQRGVRHLALVGRSGPSPSAQVIVEALRRRGVALKTYQADIADREQTQHVLADVERTMGPLRGIVHAAMVLDDAPIELLDEERMWTAMRPKLLGAWNLHALTTDAPLDFFVLFSSVTSTIGNPGQANYVAGNAFLDMLAHYRTARGLPALTVNWGGVGEVGYVVNSTEMTEKLDRFGVTLMPLSETLDTLDELISSDAVQVTVAQIEWKDVSRIFGSRVPARFCDLMGTITNDESRTTVSADVHAILEAGTAELPALLGTYIREQLARAIGISPNRIDLQQSLLSLGVDSLIALEMRNRLNADLDLNIPLAKLMQSESIEAFAAYIADRLQAGTRSESTPVTKILPDTRSELPLSGPDAANLLERIDDLTDEEIERHLSLLETQGQS
jgi:acyl transferase domain-containing protein/ubiquinone/menaquinone biosynthesis C-methylase UbiE/acyl carrier protein